MGKKEKINKNFNYGSHKPILKAIIDIYSSQSCLELGMGTNSTPILYNKVPQLISIENDKIWLKAMKRKLQPRKNFITLWHELPNYINIKTKPNDIKPKIKNNAQNFYHNIVDTFLSSKLDLLFVDQFACLRTISLKIFYKHFDIIIIHDTQPSANHLYDYHEFFKLESVIKELYTVFNFESFIPNTTVLINNNFKNLRQFIEKTKEYGKEYCESFNCDYNHRYRLI